MNRFLSTALGAAAAGTMVLGLGSGTAGASCASAFGFGNTSQCSSSPTTIAIALGSGAEAHAEGGLGTAIALGNGAFAGVYGWFSSATAAGNNSSAVAGILSVAVAAGTNGKAHAGAGNGEGANVALEIGSSDAEAYGGSGNVAVNLFGTGSQVLSLGTGDLAFNIGNGNNVWAFGKLSSATNLGGTNSLVQTDSQGTANSAFAVLGSGNWVAAGRGPLAVAGAAFTSNQVIFKIGPGLNINGIKAGGAAATPPAAVGAKHVATHGVGGSKRRHA